MVNVHLKHAIAIGPHMVNVGQTGSNQRSSAKGNHGDDANSPTFQFPGVDSHSHLSAFCGKSLVAIRSGNQCEGLEPATYVTAPCCLKRPKSVGVMSTTR